MLRWWTGILLVAVATAVVLAALVAPLYDGPEIRFAPTVTEADASRLDRDLASSAGEQMDCGDRGNQPDLDIYVNRVGFGDATDDGREDAVVALACEGYTSGWPDWVFVLDAETEQQHLLIDGSQDRRNISVTAVTVSTATVTLTGGFQDRPGPEIGTDFVRRFIYSDGGFAEAPVAPSTALRQIHLADAPAVAEVVDFWVPQLSAKKPGLMVDGQPFDDAAILTDHQSLRARFPEARLLWSGDFTSFTGTDYWVTVTAVPFATPTQANAWCDRRSLPADQCFAKRVSTTAGPQASTERR